MARSAPATPAPTPAPAAPAPALPDLSGVDFAALGRYIDSKKKPVAVAKPATTRVNPVAARLR